DSSRVFPGVEIAGGVCYFLWERDSCGPCEVINDYGNATNTSTVRALNEFQTFVRRGDAVCIIRKILSYKENSDKKLSDVVSPSKPFGLRTFYSPKKQGIPCWFIQRIGLQFADPSHVFDENGL